MASSLSVHWSHAGKLNSVQTFLWLMILKHLVVSLRALWGVKLSLEFLTSRYSSNSDKEASDVLYASHNWIFPKGFLFYFILINSLQLSFMNSFHEVRRSFPLLLRLCRPALCGGFAWYFHAFESHRNKQWFRALGDGSFSCLFCIELRRTLCASWQFAPSDGAGGQLAKLTVEIQTASEPEDNYSAIGNTWAAPTRSAGPRGRSEKREAASGLLLPPVCQFHFNTGLGNEHTEVFFGCGCHVCWEFLPTVFFFFFPTGPTLWALTESTEILSCEGSPSHVTCVQLLFLVLFVWWIHCFSEIKI